MPLNELSFREMKPKVFALLNQADFSRAIEQICRFPHRRVVNPLFSFLYSLDEPVRWRAVSAMGAVVSRLAEANMESARIIMRRFIWNLNDESGGIGWGSPEAMGETMALSKPLADEYAHMLVSYIRPDGNFLENEDLQAGVLWGLGRLAHVRPGHVEDAAAFLDPYLKSPRAHVRGLAVWTAAALPDHDTIARLCHFRQDEATFRLYQEGTLHRVRICDLVAKPAATCR